MAATHQRRIIYIMENNPYLQRLTNDLQKLTHHL